MILMKKLNKKEKFKNPYSIFLYGYEYRQIFNKINKLIDDNENFDVDYYRVIASYSILAFSCELYLKSIISAYDFDFNDHEHNLFKLYNKLNAKDTKKAIEIATMNIYPDKNVNFLEILKKHGKVFEKLRYMYEGHDEYDYQFLESFNLGLLEVGQSIFIFALKENTDYKRMLRKIGVKM